MFYVWIAGVSLGASAEIAMFSITGIYTVALGASTSAIGKILIVIPFWRRWACSIPNCPVKNNWNDSVASKSIEECHIPS